MYSPEDYCIEDVADGGRSVSFHKCSRKHLPNSKYCSVHALQHGEGVEGKEIINRYILDNYGLRRLEVIKETEKTVWLKNGSKLAKHSGWGQESVTIYDTFEEARGVLRNRAQSKLVAAEAAFTAAEFLTESDIKTSTD